MQSALVSTIIPVFNRPSMLREAVASVLAQTYRPIEVIIVDDGSTDDTAEVADALAYANAGVVRTIHVANAGPGLAREAGRALVRGDFVQHLDSDDILLPHKFEAQVEALRAHPECGVAYGWTHFRHRDGRVEQGPWKGSGNRIETMFPSMLVSRWWDTPTPLYRASVIDAAGPWTDLRVEEDWEYDCRIAASGVRLAYCAEWVCEVREHQLAYVSPAALRDRARSHLLMLDHARHASLTNDTHEMQFFARDLFRLARECGAVGLDAESRRLVEAARSISNALDLRVYNVIARAAGFRSAARLATLFQRLR
jgi:glycosyltransferase involved in cell wall biosynthesis